MKLPDFLKDPELNDLRERMGATDLGTFRLAVNPYRFTMKELEALIGEGIDLESLEQVRSLEDHTLGYKDRRVFLYRREVPVLAERRAPTLAELPHFHVANCANVRRLRASPTPARHAIAAREDGGFSVNLLCGTEVRTSLERLPVCADCLSELAFDGYSESLPGELRVRAMAGFTVTRFFGRYRRALVADAKSR
jgi:hypothetical protein